MSVASASAPGKVLICGGYLIVEEGNQGVSIGVTARFRTLVKTLDSCEPTEALVRVVSPQFNATFQYTVRKDALGDFSVAQTEGPESAFIQSAVLCSIASIATLPGDDQRGLGKSIEVTLKADNDFYAQRAYLASQGKSVTAENLRTVPPCNVLEGTISKTGLGSSAALTTSAVAAVHAAVGATADTERIHRVAQIAHSVAQKKIGSGFDVYTATFGTCIYSRFPPSLVDAFIASGDNAVKADALVATLREPSPWVHRTPLSGLPTNLRLILGDISYGGSTTPGMVSAVMKWRKSVADTDGNTWDQLKAANAAFISTMLALSGQDATSDDYANATSQCSKTPSAKWDALKDASPVHNAFVAFRDAAQTTRCLLRSMGEQAGVEIEPKILTKVLDDTIAQNGVVAVGCPGAGGYDAIFAIVVGDEADVRRVESFWESYVVQPSNETETATTICPLLVRSDCRGLVFE